MCLGRGAMISKQARYCLAWQIASENGTYARAEQPDRPVILQVSAHVDLLRRLSVCTRLPGVPLGPLRRQRGPGVRPWARDQSRSIHSVS